MTQEQYEALSLKELKTIAKEKELKGVSALKKSDLIAALIHDPSILFLDEPTIGLDVATKDRLREFILELNRTKKVTVFLTTHDMQDVEKLCNRVILINHGRMLYDGNLESVKEKYIRYRNLKVVFNKTYSIDELKFLQDFQDLRIQNLDDKTMLIQYNYKLYSVTDVVLRAKCKNVANKMQKIGFKKRHFKRLLNAK